MWVFNFNAPENISHDGQFHQFLDREEARSNAVVNVVIIVGDVV